MSNLPRENVYTCQSCGRFFVTVDVDHGVTPFMTRCEATPGCKGDATSSFYPKGPRPPNVPSPSHEWYRPETFVGISPLIKSHVLQGGLLLRRRTDKPPITYGDNSETVQRKIAEAIGAIQIADACKKSTNTARSY